MDHLTVFDLPRSEQPDSILFNYLPGEVRDKIFSFALSCYEDQDKLWDRDTPYVRPGHSAAQVCDTALLRTCQRVFAENWFRPWASSVHTFYLTSPERRPANELVTTVGTFQPRLDRLFAAHGEVEIPHIQVFAQMYCLEPAASELLPILRMDNFNPRKLTLTLRHHDWWWWESDARLAIKGDWIRVCRFPDSLKEVCFELESLHRKKNQIDWIADEMIKSWRLRKQDGTMMCASKDDTMVNSWAGSSTWEGYRWIRDETRSRTNDYYVKTVTWKPNKDKTVRPKPRDLVVPDSFPQVEAGPTSIDIHSLEHAGIPLDLPADETMRMLSAWEIKTYGHSWTYNPPLDENEAEGVDDDSDQHDLPNEEYNELVPGPNPGTNDDIDDQGFTEEGSNSFDFGSSNNATHVELNHNDEDGEMDSVEERSINDEDEEDDEESDDGSHHNSFDYGDDDDDDDDFISDDDNYMSDYLPPDFDDDEVFEPEEADSVPGPATANENGTDS